MKLFVVFVVIFVIKSCDGQNHPSTWSREQRSQSNLQENSDVLVNTDRLMSSIESRVLNIVRSETGLLKQQLNRLEMANARIENAVEALKTDVASLKTILDDVRDETNQDQDLSKSEKEHSSGLGKKIDGLNALVGSLRGMINKIEKDVVMVKKNLRNVHNARHNQQPQFAFVQPREDALDDGNGVCSANDPNTETGLRKIRKNFFAFCDMQTDDAAGWIVIQNRFDGSTDFFRTWNEYKDGFGNLAGEFWIGLDKIYELTSSRLYELLIVMEDVDGTKRTAKYSAFGIAGESSFYTLNMLGNYSGDSGDSLMYHAGMKFSTLDNDNDAWTDGNCARSHFGGWWYNSCDESNLNGRYFPPGKVDAARNYQGIYWSTFTGSVSSLKSVKMMIRPVDA